MTRQPGEQYVHEVIPAILEKEWAAIEQKLELVKGTAKTIHVDIIDGKFANNTTFLDPKPFETYKNDFKLEAHFMVEDPLSYIKSFSDAGFTRFIGHVEKMPDQISFVADAQLVGEVGLALDGKTGIDAITVPYDDLDLILLMMIDAGFSGQQFNEMHLQKIINLRQKTDIPIEVDGGITDQTLLKAKEAGALYFACNSFIFKNPDPKNTLASLQTLATT